MASALGVGLSMAAMELEIMGAIGTAASAVSTASAASGIATAA